MGCRGPRRTPRGRNGRPGRGRADGRRGRHRACDEVHAVGGEDAVERSVGQGLREVAGPRLDGRAREPAGHPCLASFLSARRSLSTPRSALSRPRTSARASVNAPPPPRARASADPRPRRRHGSARRDRYGPSADGARVAAAMSRRATDRAGRFRPPPTAVRARGSRTAASQRRRSGPGPGRDREPRPERTAQRDHRDPEPRP